jgi:hypothetical protein
MRKRIVRSGQEEKLIEQLRNELGASEDTEHLIDWLEDAWATWEMLKERFDQARAWQLYTASASLSQTRKRRVVPV